MSANGRDCRLCGQPLRWVRSAAHGRPMPLDPEPNPAGNVIVETTEPIPGMQLHVAKVIGKTTEGQDNLLGEERWMPHFVTCPNYDPETKKAKDLTKVPGYVE